MALRRSVAKIETAIKDVFDMNELHLAGADDDQVEAIDMEYVAVRVQGTEALEAALERFDFLDQGLKTLEQKTDFITKRDHVWTQMELVLAHIKEVQTSTMIPISKAVLDRCGENLKELEKLQEVT